MLCGGEIQQVLTAQVALRGPSLLTQTEVVVLLGEVSRVPALARVFLRTAAPLDVRFVDLLVRVLSFFDRGLGQGLTVVLGNVLQLGLVECLLVLRVLIVT